MPQNNVATTNVFYDKAYVFRDSNITDSAFYYFNKAKDLFLLGNDSLGTGKSLVNMAILSTNKGDFYGGQELSLNAIPYFNPDKKDQHIYINSNYNNLGIATYRLADYQQAIKFYDLAIKFSNDSAAIWLYLNNKASAYQELKNYPQALKIYDQILQTSPKNGTEYAMILNNSSYTKWLQNPNYKAVPFLLKSLQIRERENDFFGQNSSYATLADYYAKKRPDSAFIYAKKMYKVALKNNIVDDQLQALQKLIKFSPTQQVKRYFEIYNKLDDSVELTLNLAKNQFALIRYESEKNKSDNLILLKDNTEKEYKIIKREVLLGVLLFMVIVGVVWTALWYKKRKEKIELETKNTIRESQLRTSKKVHDVVANGLYRVMAEIENQDEINKISVLDKIEVLYEKSRDISYEQEVFSSAHFHEKIAELIKSFATEKTKISLVGNAEELWLKVNEKIKFEIEHVLQELMVNMKKHSEANNVVVRFETHDNQMNIYYVDNGIGIIDGHQFKNGLKNTGNRIKSISGLITFDTEPYQGLKVKISFPI